MPLALLSYILYHPLHSYLLCFGPSSLMRPLLPYLPTVVIWPTLRRCMPWISSPRDRSPGDAAQDPCPRVRCCINCCCVFRKIDGIPPTLQPSNQFNVTSGLWRLFPRQPLSEHWTIPNKQWHGQPLQPPELVARKRHHAPMKNQPRHPTACFQKPSYNPGILGDTHGLHGLHRLHCGREP